MSQGLPGGATAQLEQKSIISWAESETETGIILVFFDSLYLGSLKDHTDEVDEELSDVFIHPWAPG